MTLVKLKLDSNNLVTAIGWANPSQRKAGDVTEDGFVIYDVDQDEINACVVDHTKLVNGHLVLDADYTPPAIDDTKPEPSKQDKINAQLTLQIAANKTAQDKINAELLLATAAGKIGGTK